jgi:eukaryotic-like serine/threonine-protein kinase
VIAIGAGVVIFTTRPGNGIRPTDYEALTDLSESATAPALSPDGKMLAFIVGGSDFLDSGRIYVKQLLHGEPEPLTKVLGPIYGPAFSFDGTRVAFTYFTNGRTASAWNTLTVPTTGGKPTLLLGNAAGLSWIGPQQLLYSAIDSGIHMDIVTSTDDRSGLRKVYLPGHDRGMAHYSYLSPDRKSVLVIEMDGAGNWQRCRLVPFDGSSPGVQVGPLGPCTSAAWSPDGRWMYFSATVAGHSHLWRQRYPRGKPEQITFGPTEEIGVAAAPDGPLARDLARTAAAIDLDPRPERRAPRDEQRDRSGTLAVARCESSVLPGCERSGRSSEPLAAGSSTGPGGAGPAGT